MEQGIQAIDTAPGRLGTSRGRLRGLSVSGWMVTTLAVIAASVATAGVIAVEQAHGGSAAVRTRPPAAVTSVLAGPADSAAAAEARQLLTAAAAVVIADDASAADVRTAAGVAGKAHAPLLLMSPGATGRQPGPALQSAVRALHPRAVLGVGISARDLAAAAPGAKIVTSAASLPAAAPIVPLNQVAVLVHAAGRGPDFALATAATVTARAAGALVISLRGYDPRADPAAIKLLSATRPERVIGVGAGFGTGALLARRIGTAESAPQLPGGGQVLFPMRKIVALYGAPGAPALGALGQQGIRAGIARARRAARQYSRLTRVPVIPAFEIIATVAQGAPGADHQYSYVTPVAVLRPWVQAASRAGMYVTLDLQPGRANFLAQAKKYRSLLRLPNVGLALDPEWKLGPRQLPLQQIGSVNISAVNSVVTWLSRLTAHYHLPQKLLELHEFRLSMIQGIRRLDTRHDNLAIVINMDGQGAPTTKQQTWNAVVKNAPRGVFFGWKDFYVKDTPMLGPVRTLHHRPVPVLISYQ